MVNGYRKCLTGKKGVNLVLMGILGSFFWNVLRAYPGYCLEKLIQVVRMGETSSSDIADRHTGPDKRLEHFIADTQVVEYLLFAPQKTALI